MLELTYIAPEATASANLAPHSLYFNRHWGAFFAFKSGTAFSRLFHDGTIKSTSIAGLGALRYMYPVAGGQGELYCCPWYLGNYPVYQTWPLTGTINDTVPTVGYLPNDVAASESKFFFDPARGIALYCASSSIAVHDAQTKTLIRSIALGSGTYRSLAWAWADTVFCADGNTGQVRFVDYQQGAVVRQGRINPFYAATFDCLLQVIAAIGTDYRMRIYSLDDIPADLSNPAAATPLGQAQASRLAVRLTDEQGVGIAAKWVVWSLAGVEGGPVLGSLEKVVSRTDADGYARNYYFGPLAGTGQVEVMCEAEI